MNSLSTTDPGEGHNKSKKKTKLQCAELLGTSCLRISKSLSKQTNGQK